jgi:hypothetical protein
MAAAIPCKWGMEMSNDCDSLLELADKPLLVHRRYEQLLEYYQQYDLRPRMICNYNYVCSMIALADSGLGVAIVQKSAQRLINPLSRKIFCIL